MKSMVKTLVVICALFATPSFASDPEPKELVRVLSTKRYVFHFKIVNELIGGTVSVFDGDYKLIMSESLTHNKNIIDFFELPPGYYMIRIKKDDKEVNIQY